MGENKLGFPSVLAAGVGLIVATSSLMSLGQGTGMVGMSFAIAMVIACAINICSAMSIAELNSIMPNLTGGLAQYTLVSMGPFMAIVSMVGGYLFCNVISASVECAMFGNSINSVIHTGIPSNVLCIIMLIVMTAANLRGIDIFAKVQNLVAYSLIGSLVIMGVIGCFKIGAEPAIDQAWSMSQEPSEIMSMIGLAFFLFIGSEYVISIAKNVKNAKRNLPWGMIASLLVVCFMQFIIMLGMHNYTPWNELAENSTPHIFYGTSVLGRFGTIWMILVSILAVVSTTNSVISSLSYLCAGMAKIGLLPLIFLKKNKHGAPYVGILGISGIMMVINILGLSTTKQISFVILVGCVYYMFSYIISNVNVLIFRKRFAKVPRNFKTPCGILVPVLGILGNVFMIINVDGDPVIKLKIYLVCGGVFVVLSIYAFFWIWKVMRKKLFQPIDIKEVMAMENDLYLIAHRRDGENKVCCSTDRNMRRR